MFKKTLLSLAVLAATSAGFSTGAAAVDTGAFFTDATVSGGIYNLTRHRERRDAPNGDFKENIYHSTTLANVDFSSGLINGMFGFDAGIFGTYDMWDTDSSQWSEFSLIDKDGKIENGVALYKAALKMHVGDITLRAGYIQPTGPGVLGTNWSFVPGTYRGAEAVYSANNFTLAYMIADQYKNPWNYDVDNFYMKDGTEIDYVQSLGASYNFGNGVTTMIGYGGSKDFIDQYKFKVAYDTADMHLSYHFYAMGDDNGHSHSVNPIETNNVFDGLTYQHALVSKFIKDQWTFRAEATHTKSKGTESNFAFRPTGYNGGFGKSQGAYEIWWDSRSDWNHNEEIAVFVGAWYDFMNGWNAGASFAYGWDGKSNDPAVTDKLKEQAWNLDVGYTIQTGALQGASVKLHYTDYDLKTNVNSWSAAFPNAFQDERDVKLMFMMPLSF